MPPPHCRYLTGIEPMFSYAVFPREFVALENFRTGRRMLSAQELRELTEASFVFVGSEYLWLARNMVQNRYVLVSQSADGWVFDISGAGRS